MDNLTGFNPQWRAQARQVADQLGIEEAVALLPSGYDTPLEGHMTDVISPGLKQRISVARALLHKPRLILFDNADHGMDHESYVRIFEIMARLKNKATLVMVSEDRNVLSLATRVFELRRGQLTPSDLSFAQPAMTLLEERA
jgi:ABC-type bacteriocin/lantibiotic exporter with double-glycine peptidase domain